MSESKSDIPILLYKVNRDEIRCITVMEITKHLHDHVSRRM